MLKTTDLHETIGRAHCPAGVSSGEAPVAADVQADQERWSRVKKQIRAIVGDDIFSSWFVSMDIVGVEDDVVRFSVPTRFLKSWIQAHYINRILACWQAEQAAVRRVELIIRSAARRSIRACHSKPLRSVAPIRWRMPPPAKWRLAGAAIR